ncbi:4-hydroxy-tetrahydrodipicolinate reductase [Polynucleobacter sp. AP-Sving-400A-A2]|uniref:4-hydroxy-tetrahydrodipicolinate reductase n=1 Tax=Polynucleobacter sp. AP-Sving-400A-A2 TaxID=2081049 RepID=UPI001BFD58DF|nr:4-hydroxy-tetrahydrodipicolinate reductase [Polynucleobacter sp. AP-Sving-400A-A2]QWE15565.1 4-hydroxy-tetrahydrodipicolinate reductase [Polynucleobacter sp. AP-Sving-400A-A2]
MKIAIAGATGRMGKMLIEAVLNCTDAELVGALEHESCFLLGEDAGAFLGKKTGVAITSDITKALSSAEFLIDFTRPEGTMAHLAVAQKTNSKMIIGTTGLSLEQIDSLKKASANLAIVFAPNMSVGVNATFKLLEIAAKMLNEGYDIEIVEAHHRHKVDAPSGTALRMGEVIADALGEKLGDVAVYAREGHTGERKAGSIGFATIRGGDIVGDHTVLFAGEGERIEISHKSSSRQSYAQGSLRAARFLQAQGSGLYDMQDVLGLRK